MISNENWTDLARTLATEGDPLLHSPIAMERAMKVFHEYIIRVPTPSGKFHAHNNCRLISFETPEEKQFYNETEKRYIEECAKINKKSAEGRWLMLVLFGKYCAAAEFCRRYQLARYLHEAYMQGYAAVAACRFKRTIASVVRILIKDYGYKRDDISLIWGGNSAFDAKTRLTNEEIQSYLMKMAKGEPVKKKIIRQIETQLLQTEDETNEIEETKSEDLRLNAQSRNERQREIDRFQIGRSKICIFTFSAGGVGLSLHHTDKDDSGNPVSLRPRRTYITPVYSAQDLVQALGRAHRSIFSLSDTEQTILYYANTIEVQVMQKVSLKLRCLSKVVRQKESWMPLIDPDTDDNQDLVEDTQAEIDMASQETESEDDEDES